MPLILPIETGQVSDGYHTFDELYAHRCALFLCLMRAHSERAWFSCWHADGSYMDGWFIAGLDLLQPVTYHLPIHLWSQAVATGARAVNQAPPWDGHTSADVVQRLLAWATDAYQVNVKQYEKEEIVTCLACDKPIVPRPDENGYWRDDKGENAVWHADCIPSSRAKNATFVPWPGRREDWSERRDA